MEPANLNDFKEHLKFLQGCCLQHPADYNIALIDEVEAFVPAPNDDNGAALFHLSDGRFGVLNEWQDYTGHG